MKMWTKPCWGCPFTGSSIVENDRVEDITRTCNERDVHFTCHKDKDGNVGGGVEEDDDGETRSSAYDAVLCRGYYNVVFQKTGAGQLVRILERLGGIPEIEMPPGKDAEARATLVPAKKWAKASGVSRAKAPASRRRRAGR